MKLQSYSDVIVYLRKKKRSAHLLLGNGFSASYDPNIFSYNALHGFVEKLNDPLLNKLFGIVNTKNFELVMQQLDNFCELIKAFGSDDQLLNKVESANEKLKRTLLDAVEQMHPEHVFKISDEKCAQCAKFLSTFTSQEGHIFSTNYDTLLYWVLMRSKLENCIDGFGRERIDDQTDFSTEPEFSELIWGINKEKQNIHHLHGALPLFDTGIEVIKEQYEPGTYLLENIGTRLRNGEYPIFVASGTHYEKLIHIRHNQYLNYCYDQLENIEGSLVTFGFSFGENDDHVIQAINVAAKQGRKIKNKLWSIYVGVYSKDDEKHIKGIENKFKCKVNLFDAKTAGVWR